MRYLIVAIGLSLYLTGCYTMLYPPPEERYAEGYGYGEGSQVVTLPDSLDGKGVVIINQNQVVVDRYYQDPYYFRGGYYGYGRWWDPYYYNPWGYNHQRYWRRGWYDAPPGKVVPKPKTPRREEDYRGSDDRSGQSGASNGSSPQQESPTVVAKAVPAEQAQPANKEDSSKPDENRSLRPTQDTASPAPPPVEEKKDDAKQRRGNTRER